MRVGTGAWAAALAIALLSVAACDTGAAPNDTATPSVSPSVSSSASASATSSSSSTPSSSEPPGAGLRGARSGSMTCPIAWPTRSADAALQIPGEVQLYRICPVILGPSQAPQGAVIDVSSSNSALFVAISQALAEPDETSVPGGVCPAMAQLPIVVLVHSTSGDWVAHLPTDGCGFYKPAISNALAQASR
ncbi:MAG: hypothetical protein WCI29_13345 [Actinomycetes bacterium]